MGANARKRAGLRRPAPRRPLDFDAPDTMVVAAATRTSCSECGSAQLHWAQVRDGIEHAGLQQRVAFLDALTAGMDAHAPAWWCGDCTGVGIVLPALLTADLF